MTYKTITTEVEVDLSEFSDDEIMAEFKNRYNSDPFVGEHELARCYQLHHAGKRDEAYDILWQMCLDKLNKVY